MITKETFYAEMHKALKARKIPKLERDERIKDKWKLVKMGCAIADEIVEYEERYTRFILYGEKQ